MMVIQFNADELDPLQLITIKPGEPAFMPKNHVQFDIPAEMMNQRFRDAARELESNLDNEIPKIPVKSIPLPDIEKAKQLPKTSTFNVFNPIHKEYVVELVKLFMAAKDKQELLSLAIYTRDNVNAQLFFYAYSIALGHRSDTADLDLPSALESNPDNFITNSTMFDAKQEAFVVPPHLRRPIEIPEQFASTDIHPEQRMAYFREDIGVNFHHFHWHIVYPTEGPVELVRKDRRGELFLYMHSQILARYNLERLCNKLKVLEELNLACTKTIKHGYYSKLTTSGSSRTLVGRQDNARIEDIAGTATNPAIKVCDVETYVNRIRDGILQGFLINSQGQRVSINNNQGVDILGNVLEASSLSINSTFYGDIHNLGHILLSQIHDPDNDFMEEPGIMGATNTAMRDPAFYEWHSFTDNLFKLHKNMLPPYTERELGFTNIVARNVEILNEEGEPTDVLTTFWQKSEVNLSTGLDYVGDGAIRVKFKHLNHESFTYRITVQNSGRLTRGTVRIFLLPVRDLSHDEYSLEEACRFAVEMDRFVVNLKPGTNNILRKSSESTVTIPFESIFPAVVVNQDGRDVSFLKRNTRQVHCRCGWPEYMLLPKGTVTGYPYQLFVMISDHAQDQVVSDTKSTCPISTVFCGMRNEVYPDQRPMGFPLDRKVGRSTLKGFLRSNMTSMRFSIKHVNEVRKEYKAEFVNMDLDKEKFSGL